MPENSEYVKNYKPFVLWLAFMLPVLSALAYVFAALCSGEMLVRWMLLATGVYVILLFAIAYRYEAVWWFSGGPDFVQAREAGSPRRRAYIRAHAKAFGLAVAVYGVFFVCSVRTRMPVWTDVMIFGISLIAAAVSSLRIRL